MPKTQSRTRRAPPAKQEKTGSSPLTREEPRVVSELRKLLAETAPSGEGRPLLWAYRVGKCLQTLEREKEKKNLKYGEKHVEKIAKALEPDPQKAATLITSLYQTRKFADLYSEAEAKALARKRTPPVNRFPGPFCGIPSVSAIRTN